MEEIHKSSSNVKKFITEQWEQLTIDHVIYLVIFAIILSFITEYILKIRYMKWLYYTIVIILLSRLVRSDHPVAAAESTYKLILA
jgi:hypothetical protein